MRAKACRCPSCGHKLTAATRVAGKGKPAAGDLSVCIQCGSLLRYSRALRVRLLTAEEFQKLPNDEAIVLRKMQRVIEQLRVDK